MTVNFWCLSSKIAFFFSKSTFFEIKYCFLHVNDVHSWRYSWNCGNQINVPHCQLATHCCRCHFCFGCLKVQEQRFPKYWFSFTCLMPWFRSSLLWVLDALCSFIIARMRVGLTLSCGHAGALLNFGDSLSLEDLPIQRKHAKAFCSSNVPFFAEGRPDGVRKYGNIRPAWTRPNRNSFFQKHAPFFHVRPSIRQSCFSSWHHKIKASGCAQIPCIFSHKCRNVQMFAPAAHYKKQAKVLYFDTNCGSKAVQPWSFSYVPGSEWCVRVPDPISDRTSTKRSHDLA